MTRPIGEIRQALLQAIELLPAATYREMALHVPGVDVRCPSEMERVRLTARNLAAEGHFERVGTKSVPGISRPLTLYARKRRGGWVQAGLDLGLAMQSWTRG